MDQQTESQPPWMQHHPGPMWPTELLSIDRVLPRVGMGKTAWYDAVAKRRAPAPLKLGGSSRWDSREIEAWARWTAATAPRRAG